MSINRVLGKGLSDLLGEKDPEGDVLIKEALLNIPIEQIKVGEFQPRKNFDRESINELAESIKQNGLLQPIIVSRSGESYVIIAGERRWRACQIVGMKEIPVIVKEVSDKEMLECALVENIQRKDLNIMEEAEGYLKLMGRFGYRQEELANVVGKSRSHISNIIRLNTLPDSIKNKLLNHSLSMGHGRALVGHKSAEELADIIVHKGLNVRQTEDLVRTFDRPMQENKKKIMDPDLEEMMSLLSGKFGMKVTIDQSGAGGRIVFHYYTLEQLDDILTKLT